MTRLAIAGAGWAGRVHTLAASAVSGATVPLIATRSVGSAEVLASEIGARPVTADQLPGSAEAVVVATPPPDHAALAVRLLSAGTAVLIEKPLAATLTEADAIVAAAEATGAAACYAENLLFAPALDVAVNRRVALGAIDHLEVRMAQPMPTWGHFAEPLTAGGVLTMFATRLFGRYFISGFFHASGLFGSSGGLGDDISGIMSILQRLGSMAYVWLGLFLLVIGAAYAVINILFVRNLMTFSRSLRDSNYSGEWKVEKAECVSKWLFVLGIITCVGVLCVFKDGLAAFVSGCTGAAMIVASRWIKYGVEPASVDEPFSQESEWYSSKQ